MGKLASDLLTQERFWEIIENSDKGKNLIAQLCKLSADEIFGYRYWWEHFCRKSYTQSLWAVAYTVMGGCSDDGFDYFRFWLITRGRAVYVAAMADADSLCDEFDKLDDGDYPEFEGADYAAMDALKSAHGLDFYEALRDYDLGDGSIPEITFEWSEDDEESIKKVCPKTFAKWWANDKF